MDSLPFVAMVALVFVFLLLVFGSVFTVSQTERALIERYSRFLRVTGRGLQFKIPLIDVVRRINTQLQQIETKVETKTKDNVFVTIFVSIQLYVLEVQKTTSAMPTTSFTTRRRRSNPMWPMRF